MSGLTHLDETGNARMVDVGGKPDSERVASAGARIEMRPETTQADRQWAGTKRAMC